ncbi:hypothetical protein NDA13_003674 [Ustilago tritici]|nr:hypothetical protein NDA13_003674 [Ustilago tritici]
MKDENKGKGKATAESPQTSDRDTRQAASSNVASNAAQTLASALRTTMASSQLGSLMQPASGGKAEFQGQDSIGETEELRDWLVQDLQSGGTSSSSSNVLAGAGAQTFRTTRAPEREQQEIFQNFERGMSLSDAKQGEPGFKPSDGLTRDDVGLSQAWDEATQQYRWQATGLDPASARPIRSYTELDAPLHDSVRVSSTQAPPSQSWTYASPATALLAQTDDVFALLDAEDQLAPTSIASVSTAPQSEELSEQFLSQFDSLYRPPSPTYPSFSREQAKLHLQLAEAQASQQGKTELGIPRPDNPSLQEGVYAPTSEQALQSIFDGRVESSDVTEKQDVSDRGEEIVRKITKYFGASSYLDDVYGERSVLRETIEVVKKEKDGDREKRERAIRRLESLWGHLSNTPPHESKGKDWVDAWLLKNT